MSGDEQPLGNKLTRRELLGRAARAGLGLAAAGSLAPLVACAPVSAPQKEQPAAGGAPAAPAVVKGQTMAIAFWSGLFSNVVREVIVPDFEKDHGIKVGIEEGISFDAMAKIRTERANPQHTIIGVDDQYIPEARAEDLIVKLTPQDVPNMKNMFPEYLVDDGYGLGIAVSWNTLHYNTEKVKTPLTSYAQMWDPAYKGRVGIQGLDSGTGIQFFMAVAALAVGKPIKDAQYQAEAAFPKFKELKPNVHSIAKSMNTVAPLMAQGEMWLAVGASRIMAPYIDKGAPMVIVGDVKEGPFRLLNSIALVKGGPLQAQGKDFINRMLSEKVQLELSKKAYTGPVVTNVQVPAELAKLVPRGREDAAKMIILDWDHVIKNRNAWLDRWNKEIAE